MEFSKIIFLAKYVHYEVLNTKYFFEIFLRCYLVCRGRGSRLHCPDRIARAIGYRLMIWH